MCSKKGMNRMRLKKKEEVTLLALEQVLLEYYQLSNSDNEEDNDVSADHLTSLMISELPEYLVARGLIAED